MSSRKNKKEQNKKIIEDPTMESKQNLGDQLLHPENVNINYSDLYNKAKLYSPISKQEEKWKLIPAFFTNPWLNEATYRFFQLFYRY